MLGASAIFIVCVRESLINSPETVPTTSYAHPISLNVGLEATGWSNPKYFIGVYMTDMIPNTGSW